MIKKLKSKIFFLIMISLSVLVVGIILGFSILNYTNTIKTATLMMDRFSNFKDKEMLDKQEPKFGVENKSNTDVEIEVEGLYFIEVKDSNIISNSDTSNNKELKEYAIKVSNSNKETGIIGKYIYKIRKTRENNNNMVILMENEKTILHIRMLLAFSLVAIVLSLLIIYSISKKLSELIVKPVEETLEKQKQFISDASHELKTPLAVIEANADVLENEVGKNKWLTYIQNEINSMDKLINELLLLAKTENVDNIKTYKKFDLSKEVEIIISVFESMAYEKNVKINTNIQKDVVMDGNKEDIKHILSTLIDNAIKHTEAKNNVTIELSKEKNEIVLQVKNVGEPIPEAEREKIFERFYRIDKSRNRSQKRYGLGLAIAKSTVDKYNGKIEVICKDGVTNFRVSIPS